MNYRNLRVAKLIQEELGKIILREVEFPDSVSVIVTIIEVEVLRDLSQAKVKLGVLPETVAAETLNLLSKNQPFFQNLLMKKLNIKPMPRIMFELAS